MFGYIKPDLPYLYLKDDKLFNGLYCGMCKSIGNCHGQRARLALTYDIAFLSAVSHNILGIDVELKKKRCFLHPIIPRTVAKRDVLMDRLANLNTILAYYKTTDEIIDNSRGRFKRLVLRKGYKRARKAEPYIDEFVKKSYDNLRILEADKCNSVDRVAEPFSDMLKRLSIIILDKKSTEHTQRLFYYIGKWIYLIDALDDYDKDIKKSNYNPFVVCYNEVSAKEFLINHSSEISFIFMDILRNIEDSFNKIKFVFNKDLIENILLRGLPQKTKFIKERIQNDK